MRRKNTLSYSNHLVALPVAIATIASYAALDLAVTVANNGREAIEAFAREPFDLVFMDMQMPEMDGKEAAARIRLLQQGVRVPVIAMTAQPWRELCLAAGMDDYIAKPLSRGEPAEVVARNTLPAEEDVATASLRHRT